MSTAIIKFENNPEKLVYCKNESYPSGLGFELYDIVTGNGDLNEFLTSERFEVVSEIPLDIQYEYIIQDNDVHCQESWYAKDKSYHGGGIRHGGVYNLKEWKEKLSRQNEYSFKSMYVNPLKNSLMIDIIFEYHTKNDLKESFVSTFRYNNRDMNELKIALDSELDIPHYDLTEDNLKHYMMLTDETSIKHALEYYNNRKSVYDTIIHDLTSFSSKDDGRTDMCLKYSINDELDDSGNVPSKYMNIQLFVKKIAK